MKSSMVFCRNEATDNQCEKIDRSAGNLKVLGTECIKTE